MADKKPIADAVFASAVRRYREQAGMTQEELAARMADLGFSFHQATVYKVETGGRKASIAEAAALAQVLNVPLSTMVETGNSRPEQFQALSRGTGELLRAIVDLRDAASRVLDHQGQVRAAFDELSGSLDVDQDELAELREEYEPLVEIEELPALYSHLRRLTVDVRIFRRRIELERGGS